MSSYCVRVIPDAHKQAINRFIAWHAGEDILNSENLTQPANDSGDMNEPFTHWYGGRGVPDDEWLYLYQHLAAELPTPEGGWPLMVGETVALTEADALAAATALAVTVRTADDATQLPQQTLSAALGAQGLQKITFDI